jgi:hypothetical protein
METLDNTAPATSTAPVAPATPAEGAFDITRYAAKETGTLMLTEADGETPLLGSDRKTQLSITMYGPGSKEAEDASAKQTSRAISTLRRKGGRGERSAADLKRNEVERLIAMTISFNGPGFVHPDAIDETGEHLFRAVYNDRSIGFIKDQAAAYLADWENFTPGSATS